MYEALHPHYKIHLFNKDQITAKYLKDIDIVAFPGGIGDSDTFDDLLKPRAGIIKDYVANGGRYLGICMGAYWAGHHYFDILDGITAEQYIKRPGADVRRSFGTVSKITWNDQQEDMYFYDGCSLLGETEKSKVVARYSNGDAMALIQGRVGIIGCHPEADKFWYDGYSWMRRHWTGGHHAQLVEFADQLMRS
jgi:glutamine amidotransferase-like uncharacterized protein